MKRRFVGFAVFMIAATPLLVAAAQCWGQVAPVPGRVPVSVGDRVKVERLSANEYAVRVDGVQVGNLDADAKLFRPILGDDWGDPVPLFRQQFDKEHGVDRSKLQPTQRTGDAVDIPDDSKKLRVSIIGTKEQRKPVVDAVKDEANIVVWQCEPDHWSLTDTETGKRIFRTDGTPTVYVQAPDGKVLHRQDDGREIVGAIRKASKGYQSDLDPDLRKPVAPPATPIAPSSLPALVVFGGIVFAMFRHKILGV